MSSPQDPDPLQRILQEAEAELTRRLLDACEAEASGVANASAAEIRQLEDALLAAAVAAEHTLTLRRRLDETSTSTPTASDGASSGSVREFKDHHGEAWRAWPVTPGRAVAGGRQLLGNYQDGWVCFEGVGGSSRRRLAGHPARWSELTDLELDSLLQRATAARERKTSGILSPRGPAR